MGLEKGIKYGKERRKPFKGAKVFDITCRNHGGCPWCESGRRHFDKKRRHRVDEEINNWRKGEEE